MLGKVKIEEAAKRKEIMAAIHKAIPNNSEGPACFWPRHGLKIVDSKGTTEMVICFQCVQYTATGAHLTEMTDQLERMSGLVRASLAKEGTDEDRERWFADDLRRDLRRHETESDAQAYEVAGRFDLNWRGLARYWRKKGD